MPPKKIGLSKAKLQEAFPHAKIRKQETKDIEQTGTLPQGLVATLQLFLRTTDFSEGLKERAYEDLVSVLLRYVLEDVRQKEDIPGELVLFRETQLQAREDRVSTGPNPNGPVEFIFALRATGNDLTFRLMNVEVKRPKTVNDHAVAQTVVEGCCCASLNTRNWMDEYQDDGAIHADGNLCIRCGKDCDDDTHYEESVEFWAERQAEALDATFTVYSVLTDFRRWFFWSICGATDRTEEIISVRKLAINPTLKNVITSQGTLTEDNLRCTFFVLRYLLNDSLREIKDIINGEY